MSEPRVKTEFWVQATLRLAAATGAHGVVARRGDSEAGGVLVQLRGRPGFAVLSRVTAPDGEPLWLRATGPSPVSEPDADAYVARQIARDPDLWVLEFESAELALPFPARLAD